MFELRVLFLCTENSCRSQMAEGWARHLKRNLVEPFSAGVSPRGLDPRAVKVMAEAGVDISRQSSKPLDGFRGRLFDYVITLCDQVQENCPVFPGKAKIFHVSFENPALLAKDASSEEEALTHYRRVRDAIRAFIEALPNYRDGQGSIAGRMQAWLGEAVRK